MFRKAFSFGGSLLLAGAVVLATPGLGQAQHGGGHGGGGHGGGGHIGGGHVGGGQFGGARFGGFRNRGFDHRGFPRFFGSGFYPGYYYPDSYDSYPYVGDSYPYVGPSSTYDSGYSGSSADLAPAAGSYPMVSPPTDNTAHVSVSAPADAEIWFEGTKTTSTGPVRQYQSPPLTPGGPYTYEIRARWNQNGQEVDQTQNVKVTAGSHVSVGFPVPSKTTGQVSSTEEP